MNQFIKDYAKLSGVKLWQIAERLGMHDSNFSKLLRHPLSAEEEQKISRIVDELASNKEDNCYEK